MKLLSISIILLLSVTSLLFFREAKTSAQTKTIIATIPLEKSSGRPARIDRDRCGIVLIDAQPAFFKSMHGEREPVLERLEQLMMFASIANLPTLATFEHPTEHNGWLPERLEKVFPKQGQRMVKKTFDCCREPEIKNALSGLGVEQIILAGAETDVCVLQSALGLIEMGFEVFLLEDCVFSHETQPEPALRRLYQAGVIPCSYKTFFFEMDQSVSVDSLPKAWRLRLKAYHGRFKSPYDLSPRR